MRKIEVTPTWHMSADCCRAWRVIKKQKNQSFQPELWFPSAEETSRRRKRGSKESGEMQGAF